MSARIDIINTALTWLGADQITSSEDDSDEARVMKTNYDMTRDATLEAHEWSFAIKRFIPARLAEPPVYGAKYQFAIPSDILRILRVEDNRATGFGDLYSDRVIDRRREADWFVESGVILTDKESIMCRGIRRVEDEGIFSPLFSHAFSAHLAMLTASSLTRSAAIFNEVSALYNLKIQEAKSRDGLQGSSRRIRNRSLNDVR